MSNEYQEFVEICQAAAISITTFAKEADIPAPVLGAACSMVASAIEKTIEQEMAPDYLAAAEAISRKVAEGEISVEEGIEQAQALAKKHRKDKKAGEREGNVTYANFTKH